MIKLRDESGMAMITAILAVVVGVSLSAVGFQLAHHDLDQSAGNRRSVQAIHAAEAGIDRFLDYLITAPTNMPNCSLPSETLNTAPPAQFAVTASYRDANGVTLTCTSGHLTSTPSDVLITSVGTSAGKSRTMEAFVGLKSTPEGAPLANGAVFADSSAAWSGAASVLGNPDDADLYSNGPLNISGGGTIYGDVSAQGSITLGGSTDVKKNATAKLLLELKGGAIVRGDARSTTNSVANAGTIGANAYYCTGVAPDNPVGGSKIRECPDPPGPVARAFPTFVYIPGDWVNAGYAVNTFTDCTTAKNFINGIVSGKQVVRINSTCELNLQGTVLVKNNLAIISDGGLKMNGGATFTPVPSSPNPPYTLHMMQNINTARPCSTSITGINATGQTTTQNGIQALFYSPCDVKFAGGSLSVTGQVFAGNVTFSSTSNIYYKTIIIPGLPATGFEESLRYRREVN